jgi:hypothetical protein
MRNACIAATSSSVAWRKVIVLSNARDQRRRAVGAPLARVAVDFQLAVPASGVTTSTERCIA